MDFSSFGLTSAICPDESTTVTADSANRVSAIADTLGLIANYTQGTDANKPLLTRSDNLENLIQRSEDLTSDWSTVGTVVLSATSFREDTSTGSHYIQNTLSFGSATGINYIFSARIKPVATRAIRFEFFQAATIAHIVVDSTGTQRASFGSPQNVSIVPLGGGWYDISYSKVATTTGVAFLLIRTLQEPSLNTSYTGDGATSVEVTRIQVRTSASDAVYLQTTGAQQYRGVNGRRALRFDGVQQAGTTTLLSSIFSASAGIIYAVVRVDLLGSEHQITRASTAAQYALRTRSANGFYFINSDGSADYSEVTGASTSTTYIVRGRHSSGFIYTAIDSGNGFTEGTGVASGNSADLTGTYGIGAIAGTAIYGDIAFIGTDNTGTPNIALETYLRQEFLTSGRLTFNPFTGKFSTALTLNAKLKEMLLNRGFPF